MEETLSKKDLQCLARTLQAQMFHINTTVGNREEANYCALCKEVHNCYKNNSDGDIIKYQSRYKNVLFKLQSITGVFLGFEKYETVSQSE